MELLKYLQEMLGAVYISTKNKDELLHNYSILLKKKKSILDTIRNALMYEEDITFTLESWQIDLLQLQSDTILFDSSNNVIEYPSYFSKEELTIINLLKRIAYNPEQITNTEMQLLIKFFKNRKLVEDILFSSGNGLKLNKRALKRVLSLFENKYPTTGSNIRTYESLCLELSLTKINPHKLEKKIV